MDAHSLNDNFQFGVRWKLLLWLGIVLVPVAIAALASVRVIDSRLTDQIEEDLVNTLRLEAIRIQDELDDARMIARSLTMGTHIRLFVSGIHRYRTGQLADGVAIGGFDDYPGD